MSTNTMKTEREIFDAWWSSATSSTLGSDHAWATWQARAALQAEPAAPQAGAELASKAMAAMEDPWRDLFWTVARSVNCLPSTFPDANQHVLRKIAALATPPVAPELAPQAPERGQALLRECLSTLRMWADVAPAVSLCRDVEAYLGSD